MVSPIPTTNKSSRQLQSGGAGAIVTAKRPLVTALNGAARIG